MPSVVDGTYRLVGVIQGSQPAAYYRQCLHRLQPRRADGRLNLSCDCAAWISNQRGDRTCKHTDVTAKLLDQQLLPGHRSLRDEPVASATVVAMQPLLQPFGERAVRVEEYVAPVSGAAYRFSFLELGLETGAARAFVATNLRHALSLQDTAMAVAAWAGWAVCRELAQRAGFDVGPPPQNFYRMRRGARRRADGDGLEIVDLLEVGQRDLRDGRTKSQRAEAMLRTFLGPLYTQLTTPGLGFIDVSSKQHRGWVYRLRLDPHRRVDRRIRVFVNGRYEENCYDRRRGFDLCVVRSWEARSIPVQDAFLSNFLELCADERLLWRRLSNSNILCTYSDFRHERETVPAVWQPDPVAASAGAPHAPHAAAHL
ncbi:MAG: hypothetical protein DIU80_011015 [Chloroflexota bacterium]|nr:MAG: hypothetical protein DIU80_20135 [Chloroflexota bacterium]